ncbi:MAG: FkbM family methyltransferase [Dehalococcoidales bacterium]|nr:FkbM family methyltransferase [Dehalococcoidales bacterium]
MSNTIKKFFRKILPPTAEAINRRLSTLQRELAEQKEIVELISAAFEEEKQRSESILVNLDQEKQKLESILSEFNVLKIYSASVFTELNREKQRSDFILAELNRIILNYESLISESTRQKEHLDSFVAVLEEVKKKLEALAGNFEESAQESARLIIGLIDEISEINSKISVKEFYNNDAERHAVKRFYAITDSSGFKEKYLALIKGLDPESIETIVTILNRQQLIRNTEGKNIDLYSRDEQEGFVKLREKFYSNVYKIADDLFCYKHYLLPIHHFEASVLYYKLGLGFVHSIDAIKNKDIIDAGAYIGDSALILAPLTLKKVYSFEPVTENYQLLLKTIELNRLRNVVPEQIALGSKSGTVYINISGSCSAINKHTNNNIPNHENVNIIALDEYVKKNSLDVGLIKVDVEGYEHDFLEGAENTIKTQKPILLLSIYHSDSANDFFDIKPMIESWELGYQFKIYKPVTKSIYTETMLIAEVR